MFEIDIHTTIWRIISAFRIFGLWRKEESTARNKGIKFLSVTFNISFVLSLVTGAVLSSDKDESIFLLAVGITIVVLIIRQCYILWKKEEILTFLHEIATHSFQDREGYLEINKRLNHFMIFVSGYMVVTFLGYIFFCILCLPVFSQVKRLPINIGFPLDWKDNIIVYWIAFAYVLGALMYCIICGLLNLIVWYLMINCSIKYQILGTECRNICTTLNERNYSQSKQFYHQKLIAVIKSHQTIQRTIGSFKSFFENMFFTQITTSGICICGSVYVLAFSDHSNLIESAIYVLTLLYNVFDIFMVMYFGNEIKLFSGRLSYCLFESNWTEMPKKCTRYVIIMNEVLKKPQELVIYKLYPLDLNTFRAILKMVYSMFNVLQNVN